MPDATRNWRGSRLRKHADYQRVYGASRRHSSPSMTYFFRLRGADEGACAPARVGLTTGRVLGKAVERNRIRRRMREAVRKHHAVLPPGADVVLHPRRAVLELDFAKLETEIARIFSSVSARVAAQPASGGAR